MTTPPGAAAPGVPAAEGRGPTLHHLDHSQSHRILWLLEELGIPYTLVHHFRINARAPPTLLAIHPLGKSPLLVTADDGLVLAESSLIIEYLLRRYDTPTHKFSLPLYPIVGIPVPDGEDAPGTKEGGVKGREEALAAEKAWIKQESLTSFSGASVGGILTTKTMLHVAVSKGPFLLKPLFWAVYQGLEVGFVRGELEKFIVYMEDQLGENEWFSGRSEPGKVDFMLSWVGDQLRQRGYYVTDKDKKTGGRRYEKFNKWLDRVQGREAYKRALEKGNGYDLVDYEKWK